MEYLRELNLGKKVPVGKRVCVVGGGNSAIDAARAALRDKDCENVAIFYRRTKAEMPALAEEVDAAIDEGIEIQFLVAPIKVLTKNGKAVAIECVRMKLGEKDASGRPKPVPIEGSEFHNVARYPHPGHQRAARHLLYRRGGRHQQGRENIVIDGETSMTTGMECSPAATPLPGPGTFVEAMAAGKLAAETIEKYVCGMPLAREYRLTRPSIYVEPVKPRRGGGQGQASQMKHLAVARGGKTSRRSSSGLTEEKAVRGQALPAVRSAKPRTARKP